MVDQINKIGGLTHLQPDAAPEKISRTQHGGFDDLLHTKIKEQEDITFSQHAQERIRFRNIPMTVNEVERLKQGVNEVARKGGKESLVLMDRSAFLVSISNRTVITAIGEQQLKNNVFTNIDSAVII